MSSYASFFVRSENNLVPIGSFCRSSEIYQSVQHYANFDCITPLTEDFIEKFRDSIREKIVDYRNHLKDLHRMIDEVIPKCNNSLEEKIESIEGYKNQIEDWQNEIDDLVFAEQYFNTLHCIIDDIPYEWQTKYSKDEYIFVGIEVPEDVKIPEGCKV